ncbi:MAG: carbon-nitrogen family hydrolase [Thermodesulfobacteriota bacterium]|nr:carbon-nitrogen family hydrolase [Thermodesulfobacteriota bacterium]
MNHTIRAGGVQFRVVPGDIEKNVQSAVHGIAGLADQGVKLAVLPELWACGFDNKNLAVHAEKTPDVLGTVRNEAVRHQMVIAGSLAEADDNGIYNTLYVMDADGTLAGRYRKTHLFTAMDEHRHFLSGDRWTVCDTSAGRLGLMICYDLRFPELCRTLVLNGADCVLVCAQWPAKRAEHWKVLLRARAIENQVFVIGVNSCGSGAGEILYGGHSRIVSPWGDVLAAADGEKEAAIFADLDKGEMQRFRTAIPCLAERRPDVYHIKVNS